MLVIEDVSVRKAADTVAVGESPKQSFGPYIADEPSEPPDILM
jgi:hypothetical protein